MQRLFGPELLVSYVPLQLIFLLFELLSGIVKVFACTLLVTDTDIVGFVHFLCVVHSRGDVIHLSLKIPFVMTTALLEMTFSGVQLIFHVAFAPS